MGISPQQFEQLQARIRTGTRRSPRASNAPPAPPTPASARRIVLGIDPSLRGTGWGVIQADRNTAVALGFGTIHCPAVLARSRCLVRIAEALRQAIRTHTPDACAIEGLFFAQNLQTALLMGEARGACLLAAAEFGLEITEIAPRKVKQAIVGFGGAQKAAVAQMVLRMLSLSELPEPDAADALAIALAHARDLFRPALTPRKPL
ncbi:MAG: crossover junction endodeoxyribonuclease RuvC [Verrucomicrobiales bacterium]|nr:crossover junction endodeoxyribonuclease RuvC [Verrucomicrobiales bacterium]